MHTRTLLAALTTLVFSCSIPVDSATDGKQSSFLVVGNDDACVVAASDQALGILALVNDEMVDLDQLDRSTSKGGVGLHRTAAENIMADRPFKTIAELDAVYYVGPKSCEALRAYACELQKLCEPDLRIMTWNIENFPQSPQAADAIIATIEQLQPAIVGLQEIRDPDAFYDLASGLPGYQGLLAEPGFYTGVGLLFREDLMLSEVESLFVGDQYAFPRPPLRVVAKLGSRTITFIVVHLKAQIDTASQDRRRAAALALDAWLDEQPETEVFILGDWNDRIDSDGDVFAAFTGDPTRYEFLSAAIDDIGDYSYIPYEKLIDHILATDGAIAGRRRITTQALPLEETIPSYLDQVSDHRPVISTLSVRP